MKVMYFIYWLSALIIMAEGLNKLEQTSPFAKGLTRRERLVAGLKAMAWLLLTFGSALIAASPWLPSFGLNTSIINIIVHKEVSTPEASCVVGFALHVVRARLMEGYEYGRKADRRLHWREDRQG